MNNSMEAIHGARYNSTKKNRVKELNEEFNRWVWRHQDARGNTVQLSEFDEIVTVYSYPKHKNNGMYIPGRKKEESSILRSVTS